MSEVTCSVCGHTWNAEYLPTCPQCLLKRLIADPDLILPKHDPREPIKAENRYYSKVSMDFVTNAPIFIKTIISSGSCFKSEWDNKYCYYDTETLGVIAGSAIPANSTIPTAQLNSLLIVDLYGNPHVYAQDSIRFENEIRKGRYTIPRCSIPGCNNQRLPNSDKCIKHKS